MSETSRAHSASHTKFLSKISPSSSGKRRIISLKFHRDAAVCDVANCLLKLKHLAHAISKSLALTFACPPICEPVWEGLHAGWRVSIKSCVRRRIPAEGFDLLPHHAVCTLAPSTRSAPRMYFISPLQSAAPPVAMHAHIPTKSRRNSLMSVAKWA